MDDDKLGGFNELRNSSFATSSCSCQSPASDLDSTQIDITTLNTIESVVTTTHRDDLPLSILARELRAESSVSLCSSFSSVKTLCAPPAAMSEWNVNSVQANKNDQDSNCRLPSQSKSIEDLADKLDQLRNDWYQVIGLEQQIRAVGNQMTIMRENIGKKMNDLCQAIDSLGLAPAINSVNSNNKRVDESRDTSNQSLKSSNPLVNQPQSSFDSIVNKRFVLNEKQRNTLNDLIKSQKGLQKLPALIKGYLTRRIYQSEKVQYMIKTIADTQILLEDYNKPGQVDKGDIELHQRLMNQLERLIVDFHDIFFAYSKKEQMKLIERDRDATREKLSRSLSNDKSESPLAKRRRKQKNEDDDYAPPKNSKHTKVKPLKTGSTTRSGATSKTKKAAHVQESASKHDENRDEEVDENKEVDANNLDEPVRRSERQQKPTTSSRKKTSRKICK